MQNTIYPLPSEAEFQEFLNKDSQDQLILAEYEEKLNQSQEDATGDALETQLLKLGMVLQAI